jgi:hypothetical protein
VANMSDTCFLLTPLLLLLLAGWSLADLQHRRCRRRNCVVPGVWQQQARLYHDCCPTRLRDPCPAGAVLYPGELRVTTADHLTQILV